MRSRGLGGQFVGTAKRLLLLQTMFIALSMVAPDFGPISCYERLFNDVSRSSTCCVERILEIESSNVRR